MSKIFGIALSVMLTGCATNLMKIEEVDKSKISYAGIKQSLVGKEGRTTALKMSSGEYVCGDFRKVDKNNIYLGGPIFGEGTPHAIKNVKLIYTARSNAGGFTLMIAGGKTLWDCDDLIDYIRKQR